MAGFAWPSVFACLLVLPLIYFLAYIPYLQLSGADHHRQPGAATAGRSTSSSRGVRSLRLQRGTPAPPRGGAGRLDLKPVSFYSRSYDDRLIAVIYNGGNPDPLLGRQLHRHHLVQILAWRRRSLALVLVVAAFAFQYLPWTRISGPPPPTTTSPRSSLRWWRSSWSTRGSVVGLSVPGDRLPGRRRRRGAAVFPLGSALAMPTGTSTRPVPWRRGTMPSRFPTRPPASAAR